MKRRSRVIHKGSHRVAANRHRKVHKGISITAILLWVLLAVASIYAIASYIDSRHVIKINQDGINIVVDSVSFDDVGSYPFTSPKGEKFVIVHIDVTNNSGRVFNFAPVVQTYMVDSEGKRYYMSPAVLKDPIAAGPMSNGSRLSGSLSYLVPVNASNLTLQFRL